MATIHNTDLTKELKEGGKLQQLRDVIPSQLADKVVPVMEVNPKLLRRTEVSFSRTSTAGTIATLPAGRDFYITGFTLGVLKLVTDTGTDASLTVVVKGETIKLAVIPGITLTAQDQIIALNLTAPIKVDQGSNLITAGANISKITATILGYYVDNPNA